MEFLIGLNDFEKPWFLSLATKQLQIGIDSIKGLAFLYFSKYIQKVLKNYDGHRLIRKKLKFFQITEFNCAITELSSGSLSGIRLDI